MRLVYLDTSVLAKRYLPAPESDAVDSFLDDPSLRFAISDLCVVELESLWARRSREPDGDRIDRSRLRERVDADMRSGFFVVHALDASVLAEARRCIAGDVRLSTLDALHLATALLVGAQGLATDDRQLGRAAGAVGLAVTTFV